MALEGTYEYECMRAELLEIDKPNYEEFMKNKAEKEEAERATLEAEVNKDLQAETEQFERTSGKLDELGNILKSTQRKINNLTAPFSTYLKSKIGLSESPGASKAGNNSQVNHQAESDQDDPGEVRDSPAHINYPLEDKKDNKQDLNLGLIDRLIDKTEKSSLSMEYQAKQMKRFK